MSSHVQHLTSIMQGFKDWLSPPTTRSRAPTFGSLNGPDKMLMSACHEQFHKLSWFLFCLGHVSIKWAKAVVAYHVHTSPVDPLHWTTTLIMALWKFTRNMWTNRNQVVHGVTVQEAAEKEMQWLHDLIWDHTRNILQIIHISSLAMPIYLNDKTWRTN